MTARTILPALLGLASLCAATALPPQDKPSGFLSFPLERRHFSATKRDDSVELYNLTNVAYLVQLQIGTPPQPVKVLIDTGSFELWVDPDCSTVTDPTQQQQCQSAGHYDPNASSTVNVTDVTKQINYDKGAVALQYVLDDLSLPGSNSKTLSNVVFGVATASQDSHIGIMGLGYGKGYNLDYPNIVDELYDQGVTNSKAFSLALGSVDASNGGTLIFGGVDTKKFVGRLQRKPIIQGGTSGDFVRYWIQMDSMGVTKPGSKATNFTGSSGGVVLDSGYTVSSFPQAVAQQLADSLGGQIDSNGYIIVPCDLAKQSGTVDFSFGNLTIHVPYHQFIWSAGDNSCSGGLVVTTGSPTLGDTFLRSAYVVFDQTNEAIFLGEYVNCGQNEQALAAAPGAAASMMGECTTAASGAMANFGPSPTFWALVAAGLGFQVFMGFL